MYQRKSNWSDNDKVQAWVNVAGRHPEHPNTIWQTASCPYLYCQFPNMEMQWSKYGNENQIAWVIDHKVALANGGSNHPSNLQAMHNHCNSLKSDSF